MATRPTKDKEVNFNRKFADAESFELTAWQVVLEDSEEDSTLPWEGYVSRQLLGKGADKNNLQHYDILFKIRFNRLDEYVLAIAIADRKGGYRAGFPLLFGAQLGRLFTLKAPSAPYKPLRVEWPGTGTPSDYYASEEGMYSQPG